MTTGNSRLLEEYAQRSLKLPVGRLKELLGLITGTTRCQHELVYHDLLSEGIHYPRISASVRNHHHHHQTVSLFTVFQSIEEPRLTSGVRRVTGLAGRKRLLRSDWSARRSRFRFRLQAKTFHGGRKWVLFVNKPKQVLRKPTSSDHPNVG